MQKNDGVANDQSLRDQRELEKRRRERSRQRWLSVLSWTTPVVAFAGFFGIWHKVGQHATAAPASGTVSYGASQPNTQSFAQSGSASTSSASQAPAYQGSSRDGGYGGDDGGYGGDDGGWRHRESQGGSTNPGGTYGSSGGGSSAGGTGVPSSSVPYSGSAGSSSGGFSSSGGSGISQQPVPSFQSSAS